ncbi:MAG: aminotransferase class I/II-fold pyridoxal phosphate-dependent enzyme [Vicinamibacteria bacterium]|nr:aminotransferase class I/II-fold pyridoxal phosphate-dependent enzyme [Vicinamibacteria bacterium]
MKPAILGGEPAFSKPQAVGFPLVEPDTRSRFHALMDSAFERNWLTNDGPLVRQLERAVAELHGVEECVSACNATVAQMLALRAFELGGEVIVPSFTFVASVHACAWQGLTPVFCDIRRHDLTIDPALVERLISPRTSAIVGVHAFGNVCDVDALEEIRRRHGLRLIYDAAHAFGCSSGSQSIGGFGDVEFLSFHATKFFSTFEGGALLTRDRHLAQALRNLRNFGFAGYDNVETLGLNGKMSEAAAAMGLASLPALPARRERLASTQEAYRRHLAGVPGIALRPAGVSGRSNYHYVVVEVDAERYGVTRDHLVEALWRDNVLARKYFYPGCHRMPYYASKAAPGPAPLPVTDEISERVLCLSSNLEDVEADTARIAALLQVIHERAEEVTRLCTVAAG